MDFVCKVALVTGGAQGIGKAYSTALLDIGMKVCVCDIKEDVGRDFIGNLSDVHRENAVFQKCDVTSFDELKGVFERAIAKFGRLDLVVNNAGMFNELEWKKMIEVNFIAVINGINLAFQYMGINNGGHGGLVINTASERGLDPFDLAPIYCGTKHGVVGLTKSYGTDFHFKKSGVTVNAICPGATETNMYRACTAYCLDEKVASKLLEGLEPVTPEFIAKALIQLLKDGKNGALLRADIDGVRYA